MRITRRERAKNQDDLSGINWLDVSEAFKATQNWELIAESQLLSVGDLESDFLKWKDKPRRAKTLSDWGKMLLAEQKIEALKQQNQKAITGTRADSNFLMELQQNQNLLSYQPRCCFASTFFMQGASLADTEKIIGKIKCKNADDCRKKCLTLAGLIVRQSLLQAATDGSVRAQMYYGDQILHLGAEGNEVFKPARLVFTPQAIDAIQKEIAKDEQR